jgi:hypothetical protein
MKMRLMLAGGLLLALTGCTTYDYVGGGRSGSYYHGAPSVEYRYPAGYPYNYGPYYGGYGGYYGGYGNPYYSRPIYRPPQSNAQPSAPPPQARPAPAPSAPRMNGSPWRNMDRATQRTVER